MAKYITQADVENVFGKENIALWSNLDGEEYADATRIQAAIEYAEEDIENRFRGTKYSLPFSPVAYVVKDWCARLAGFWLFNNRPDYDDEDDGFKAQKRDLDAAIRGYINGDSDLPCTTKTEGVSEAPFVVI